MAGPASRPLGNQLVGAHNMTSAQALRLHAGKGDMLRGTLEHLTQQ